MFDNLRNNLTYMLAPKEMKRAMTTSLPQAFVSPIHMTGAPPVLGTAELLLAYSKMPWLRTIVNKVGRSVGNTTWKLFIEKSSQGNRAIKPFKLQRADLQTRKKLLKQSEANGNLQEIEDHPLLDFLDFGNPQLNGKASMETTQIHMDLVGEAFWLLERNGLGSPVAWWPIPPDWIKNLPAQDRPFFVLSIGTLAQVNVPEKEIISFFEPDPANPYGRGTGIAKSLGDELETDEYAAKHLKAFFFNRARPDVIISGDTLSRDDTSRLEERWLDKHQGFWNAWKPHFLSRKVDIKEMGQSFENMQMVEIRKHERDTIIQVYGVPPEKFGIVNESKRSTIAAADFFWTKDIIAPRLEALRTVLQRDLIPMFDDRLILDFESPTVEDAEHRLTIMKGASWAFTRNEWRKEAGLDPAPEDSGDMYVVPINTFERPVEGTLMDGSESMSLLQQENEPVPDPAKPPPDNEGNENDSKLLASSLELRLDEISERITTMVKERMLERVSGS